MTETTFCIDGERHRILSAPAYALADFVASEPVGLLPDSDPVTWAPHPEVFAVSQAIAAHILRERG